MGVKLSCLVAAASLALSLSSSRAQAHSGPPRGSGIIVSPADPNQVLIRTTYGMVMTLDGGDSFGWLCGSAADYNDEIELPEAAIFSNQAMLLGTFKGPTRSANAGCDWDFLGGELDGKFIRHIAPGQTPDEAIMLYTNAVGGFSFEVELWQTSDAGEQWTLIGLPPPNDFLPFNAVIAPSNPDRIYMAGQDGTLGSLRQIVMRSNDRGMTWERIVVTENAPNASTVIIGIDPMDEDILYISSTTIPGSPLFQLFRTNDGNTFEEVWQRPWEGVNADLSPDGTTLAIGAPEHGLLLAPADPLAATLTTSPAADVAVSCLNWSADALYACTDEDRDGYSVGISKDGGATFSSFMRLDSPCSPLRCDSGSDIDNVCPEEWRVEQLELGADNCYDYPEPPPEPPTTEASCSCEAAAPQNTLGWLASGVLLGAMFLQRRRRRGA